jgi:hypothetical protein
VSRGRSHDDEDALTVYDLGVGSAQPARGDGDDADDYPLAVLWLPNPDAWRGWEMRRVNRKPAEKPRRRLGFGA